MRKRFSEEQIVRILGDAAGHGVPGTARKYGVSEQTLYLWRRRYEGMDVSQVAELKRLQQGCEVFSVARSALDCVARRPVQYAKLVAWMQGIVRVYADWGYRLAHGRAVNCGWQVSRNRFHRLWQKHHLQQPLRVPQRKIITGARLDPQPLIRNPVWCYDFVHDRDAAGRMIRCKDEATAYALAIVPALRYSAEDVRRVLERLVKEYGCPAYLRSDRGGEFIAHELRQWLSDNRIQPAYIDAGKP